MMTRLVDMCLPGCGSTQTAQQIARAARACSSRAGGRRLADVSPHQRGRGLRRRGPHAGCQLLLCLASSQLVGRGLLGGFINAHAAPFAAGAGRRHGCAAGHMFTVKSAAAEQAVQVVAALPLAEQQLNLLLLHICTGSRAALGGLTEAASTFAAALPEAAADVSEAACARQRALHRGCCCGAGSCSCHISSAGIRVVEAASMAAISPGSRLQCWHIQRTGDAPRLARWRSVDAAAAAQIWAVGQGTL